MALSYFDNKAIPPTDDSVVAVLSDSFETWQKIVEYVSATYKNISAEWKMYTKDSGWTLILKSGKRTLLYLVPQQGTFVLHFVYSEKAREAALARTDLPDSIKKQIPDEKQCVSGHGFTVEAGFETAKILIEIKSKN